jgi:hypothetical protein
MANQTTAPFRQRCLISCRIGTRPLCSSITTHAPAETVRNVHRHSSVTGPRAELSSFKPTSASQAMNLHRRYRYQTNKMCQRIHSPRHTTHPLTTIIIPYAAAFPQLFVKSSLHNSNPNATPHPNTAPARRISIPPDPAAAATVDHRYAVSVSRRRTTSRQPSHSMRPEMSRRSSASVLSCFWWRHTGRVFGGTAYAVRWEDWGWDW